MISLEEEILQDFAQFTHDPLGCVLYSFPWGTGDLEGANVRQWQADELDSLGRHLRNPETRHTPYLSAVTSGHGIGKSAFIGFITHWALSTFEDCKVVITANTGDQLATKTQPEVAKWFRMAINADWFAVNATSVRSKDPAHDVTWRADFLTWSQNNTNAFAGLHNKNKRLVIIYDEAAEIDDKLWEVTDGALTDENTEIIWFVFSQPTTNTGRFRECFGKFKNWWHRRQIDSRTVEGTSKDLFDRWVKVFGVDSDFCRVRVRGEFPRAASSQFISADVVSAARERIVSDQSRAFIILSVDVARFGDDQTVIGYRQGLYSEILEKIRGEDTTQVAMRAMYYIKKLNARTAVVDGDGIGGGVADYIRLHMADWMEARKDTFRLEEFHGGNSPGDAFMYFNRRAEAWGLMKDWLETAQIPDDAELSDDLTGPKYLFSSNNQIQLEKKEDMKKRSLASPDCGDMLAMTFTVTVIPKTYQEALVERIQATKDPTERHFIRLAETERRQKAKQPLQYWE